jgi:NACHT domain
MVGLELGLTALALDTIKEVAKKESGSTLAKWGNKDIGKAFEQALFNASSQYLKNYRARHGNLKIACVRMDKPMALEDIYTAVQLLDRADLRYFETVEALQDQYRDGGRRSFRGGDGKKQDGIAVTNREQHLMVLGGPGVGKSTFLRKVGLEALKQKQGAYQHPCIPVFVELQKFKTSDIRLEQLIVQEFADCGFPEPAAFTAAMLDKGRLLILLDGLDEVPLEQEAAVIGQIKIALSPPVGWRPTKAAFPASKMWQWPRLKMSRFGSLFATGFR